MNEEERMFKYSFYFQIFYKFLSDSQDEESGISMFIHIDFSEYFCNQSYFYKGFKFLTLPIQNVVTLLSILVFYLT